MATAVTVPPRGPETRRIQLKNGNSLCIWPDGSLTLLYPIRGVLIEVDPYGDATMHLAKEHPEPRLNRRGEKGSVLVELAIALPFLLVFALGSLDLSWDATAKQSLNFIAEQSASCTLTPGCDPVALAQQNASGLTLNPNNLTVTVNDTTVTASYQAGGLVGFLPAINLQAVATAQPK